MIIRSVSRKKLEIKENGRSTDFLTPTIIMGCSFNCSYCYCKRHKTEGVDISDNLNDILTEVNNHAMFTFIDKPNQTHPKFITYDIGCNSDMALHAKHYNWKKVFGFFKDHPKAMGSFATKYVNYNLLDFNPENKMRIRFSLMPNKLSKILEPYTSSIEERIKAIDLFIEAGYDVHINFSPIIYYYEWLKDYEELFNKVNELVVNKDKVLCEVIFLTHNRKKHLYNLENHISGEYLLWTPELQEDKISKYGGENIRYKLDIKSKFIDQWTELHNKIIPWNKIRYIF